MQAGKISFNLWVKSPLFVQQTGMHFVKTFLNKNQGMLIHFPGTLLAKHLSQRCWDAIRSQII